MIEMDGAGKMIGVSERLLEGISKQDFPEWWTFEDLQKIADGLGIKKGQTQQFVRMGKEVGAIKFGGKHRGKTMHKFVPI